MGHERDREDIEGTESLGSFLRGMREESKVSLNQFARNIDTDPAYISRIEKDIVPPSIGVLNKYAKQLGVARFYMYTKAGILDVTGLHPDNLELVQDLFNEAQITLR